MQPTEPLPIATGDAPVWVLPPALIPDRPPRIPGHTPVRVPGHLDRPTDIARAGRDPEEALEGRLHAGLDWDFCGPRPPRLGPAPDLPLPGPDTPIDIDAGALDYDDETDLLRLTGEVDLRRGTQRVQAPAIDYNRATGDLATFGPTFLEYPGLRMLGRDARLNLETEQGEMPAARYRFSGQANLRGTAELAEIINPQLTRYRDIVHTACPPGSRAWSLRARRLDLNQESGRGIARDARLRIRGLPVLYTPYLDFPIDDRRQTGILIPSVGYSDDHGFDLTVPWYWNIAPHMDATFSPRLLSKTGLLLGGEFRYLTRRDRGTLQAEIIHDRRSDEGNPRGAMRLEQEGRFFRRWSTNLDVSAVTDSTYLQDFGNTLDATSTRWLLQRGDLHYGATDWSLLTRLEAYQTIDVEAPPAWRPYRRLPQLLFQLRPQTFDPGVIGNFAAEYNYFDHAHRVHGQRLALTPTMSWPLRRSYGHLIPAAGVNFAHYQLVDTAPGQPTAVSHLVPQFDLDGRLVFDRDGQWFDRPYLQTLEPRLYYLYTPYVEQDDAPVFDSSELTFSFANLFRNNRFTGRDRIGDANQLSAALTSRVLQPSTGIEHLRLSLGRIFYFADRRVQIDRPVATARTSPYAGELAAQLLDHWTGRASFEWDPNATDRWGRRTLQLQYRSDDDRRLFNAGYRFERGTSDFDRYEDTDLSFRLAVGRHTELVGRWLYSLLNDETSEFFAGIEFGQCCWKVRVLGRHYRNRPDAAANNSIMLQFELAGLAAIGSPVRSFLEQEIHDYQAF